MKFAPTFKYGKRKNFYSTELPPKPSVYSIKNEHPDIYTGVNGSSTYMCTLGGRHSQGRVFITVPREVDNKMNLIYLGYQTLSLYAYNSINTSHKFFGIKSLRPA